MAEHPEPSGNDDALPSRRTVPPLGWVIRLLFGFCLLASRAEAQASNGVAVVSPEEAFPASATPAFFEAHAAAGEKTPGDGSGQATDRTASTSATTPSDWQTLLSPAEITPTLRTVMLVGALSLVPALLVMTTCFARFAIVFGLLRQGLGAQQWLPNQILLALCLFLTLFVMAPVWSQSYEAGLRPYAEGTYVTTADQRDALESAFTAAVQPVRQFMSTQIAATGNAAAIDMLLSYQQADAPRTQQPQYYEDVPLSVLLPAYLLSELKTAFVIGFQIVLPFLVIDLVVASLLTAMGLMMLPPALVALPFKLLLFVLIDGWTLTVEMLLNSLPSG